MVRTEPSLSLRTKGRTLGTLFTLAVFVAAGAVAAPSLASRPPLPTEQWDQTSQLTLARAMVGEADWHEPDHVAIAFVLARRWHKQFQNRSEPMTFPELIQRYSASLRNTTPRGTWIRNLVWAPLPGPYQGRWDRVRKLVDAWGQGLVKDPCPTAMHWGGAMDRPSNQYHAVSCGLTRNIFYARRDQK
jgi:hypothetical protein